MVLSRDRVDAGIRSTQVGDPLADGRDGVANCSRPNRLVILSVAAVVESVDEEVGELLVHAHDITEDDISVVFVAEGLPVPMIPALAFRVFEVVAVEAMSSAALRSVVKRSRLAGEEAATACPADTVWRSERERTRR